MISCPWCGDLYEKNHPRRKYCSQLCMQRAWKAANRERVREQGRARRAANPEKVRDKERRYRASVQERRRDQRRAWRAADPEKAREYNRRYRATNPESARESAQKYRAANPEITRAWSQRRRAAEAQAPLEQFTNLEIFERDGWQCQLCKKRVDPILNWPDGLSATLDHVVPVSKGGGHVRANVQLAHLKCNLSKGARVAATGEQLKRVP